MCAVINQRKESAKPKYPMLTKNTHSHTCLRVSEVIKLTCGKLSPLRLKRKQVLQGHSGLIKGLPVEGPYSQIVFY